MYPETYNAIQINPNAQAFITTLQQINKMSGVTNTLETKPTYAEDGVRTTPAGFALVYT